MSKTQKRNESRTNALEYAQIYANESPRVSISSRIRSRMRSLRRFVGAIDDFDWDRYPEHYRAEHEFNLRFFTDDLRDVDFIFTNTRLYLLADCKPLNPTHRCLLEAICNLPDANSFAEIGVGGGRNLANLRAILGEHVRLFGYDRSPTQIEFFKELFPSVFAQTVTGIMDLTERPVPLDPLPDVVFASTVLMHIKRPEAYRSGLSHLLASARKFVVIMDNWSAHDYFTDLTVYAGTEPARMYAYDSGGNVAVVVARNGATLSDPYVPLNDSTILQRYR